MLYFTPNGKKVIYAVANPYKNMDPNTHTFRTSDPQLYVNDKKINLPGYIFPIFSTDGEHLAYSNGKEHEYFMILDGKEQKHYYKVGSPTFSPDGKLAYAAEDDTSTFVVINGEEGKHYPGVNLDSYSSSLVFSKDGTQEAHIVTQGKMLPDYHEFIVLNGKGQSPFQQVESPIFSPDGKHLAYIASLGKEKFVVLDGKKIGKHYTGRISSLGFSNYGQLVYLAYNARFMDIGEQRIEVGHDAAVIVLNGEEIKSPFFSANGALSMPALSPDGKHLAYTTNFIPGEIGKYGYTIVVDDKAMAEKYSFIDSLIWSSDSTSLAYVAEKYDSTNTKKNWVIGINGREIKVLDSPPRSLTFSPDNKSVMYGLHVGTDLTDKELWWMVEPIR